MSDFYSKLVRHCFLPGFIFFASGAPWVLSQEPAPAATPTTQTTTAAPSSPEGQPPATPAEPAPDGATPTATPGATPPGSPTPGAPAPGTPVPGTPTPGAPAAGTPGAPDAAAAPKLPPPVTRASIKPGEANPDELKVRPKEDGTIEFQFRNQPWPALLQWLAEICNMSLDWQELPGDQLNLATQRPYTLVDARDLINRHLLLRGYTMLESEGVLTIAKLDAVNVALVPRVTPEELEKLPPSRYVRTSVPVTALEATVLLEEIKPMLSGFGKAHALKATNRLELMDCAVNLREIYAILQHEQSPEALQDLAREFVLKHMRALEAKELLELFLGIAKQDKNAGSMPPEMMQMQMQMQMQSQMMEQQAAAAAPGGVPKKDKDLNIVANIRLNSLIVHAPADKMALIASFIERIDSPTPIMDMSMLGTKMKVYRLQSVDPEQLITSLIQMDALEPQTKLQVDKDNSAIIAYGSIADHYVIQQVLERLDGSGRQFEVLQMRRLKADEVAGTIQFLMVPKEEETQQRDPYGGFFFGFSPPQDDKKKKTQDKFRVSANVRDNQILLWANETELEEVRKLLVKLGEISPESGNNRLQFSVDVSPAPETLEYLQQLKKQWESFSDVPLELPPAELFESQLQQIDPAKKESSDEQDSNKDMPESPSSEAKPDISRNAPPPSSAPPSNDLIRQTAIAHVIEGERKVQMTLSPDGQLQIFSSDPKLLEQLETLMQQNPPPKKQFDVFRVQWARASWIKLSLDEYFREQMKNEEENDEMDGFLSWLVFDELRPKEEKKPELGKKTPVRFMADNDTSTIIAIGADETERQTIRELIRIWDVPEPTNSSNIRFTKLVQIKYSRAEVIAEALKDAYRDLLSANDKAFQQQSGSSSTVGGKENKREAQNESATVSSSGGLSFAFKGELSIGVDKVTNTLVVSAKGKELLELITGVIEELDEAAQPQGTTRVVTVSPEMSSKSLEKALRAMMMQQQEQQQPQAQQPQAPQTPNIPAVAAPVIQSTEAAGEGSGE
jgi:type II secretory pathway component GspD/PulD (secretin)